MVSLNLVQFGGTALKLFLCCRERGSNVYPNQSINCFFWQDSALWLFIDTDCCSLQAVFQEKDRWWGWKAFAQVSCVSSLAGVPLSKTLNPKIYVISVGKKVGCFEGCGWRLHSAGFCANRKKASGRGEMSKSDFERQIWMSQQILLSSETGHIIKSQRMAAAPPAEETFTICSLR